MQSICPHAGATRVRDDSFQAVGMFAGVGVPCVGIFPAIHSSAHCSLMKKRYLCSVPTSCFINGRKSIGWILASMEGRHAERMSLPGGGRHFSDCELQKSPRHLPWFKRRLSVARYPQYHTGGLARPQRPPFQDRWPINPNDSTLLRQGRDTALLPAGNPACFVAILEATAQRPALSTIFGRIVSAWP